jgi:DNA processing protein
MSLLAPSPTAPIDYADERTVRLLLSRLIEPEDHLFAELRESTAPAPAEPAELLRAIVGDRASPPPPWPARLAERLESRRAGIWMKLACADPAADLEAGAAAEARFLIPGDAEWPSGLDDLGGRAPFGIWIIGRFETRAPAVAMVGARACTGYGSQAAGQLAADLARVGTTIVSGAALGVDGAAHRGALAVGGTTVAVLACGIDRSYPASHRMLIEAIGQRGAVLAELPPGTSPTRFRFLARNRLIAALGTGTVVVEAASRSGSLVTARLAAELGRAVFAVPGPVTSRQSMGTNQLLCDGAIPAVDGPQILAELGVESARREPEARRADTPSGIASDAAPLDPYAMLVREALPTARSGRAAEVLSLATATGLAPPQVLALLGQLAARGQAVKTGGGWALR